MRCKACKNKIKEGEEMKIQLSTIHRDCLELYIGKHIEKVRVDKKENERRFKIAGQRKKQESGIRTTQTVFNKYIRLRDTTEGIGSCISCSKQIKLGTKDAQAGHYLSVGARSDLRFKEDNVHLQCNRCNVYGTAKEGSKYTENLKKKIGQKRFDKLKERKKQDYSVEGLKKTRQKYAKKIKELQ